jgi:hypothetical protein
MPPPVRASVSVTGDGHTSVSVAQIPNGVRIDITQPIMKFVPEAAIRAVIDGRTYVVPSEPNRSQHADNLGAELARLIREDRGANLDAVAKRHGHAFGSTVFVTRR